MRYHALACDYDGTIAHHGHVDNETIAALGRLRASGRRLILVTGRELQDLFTVCPHIGLFDRVVAENGALVYCPATREEKLLGEPPPEPFVRALRERGVSPVAVGRVLRHLGYLIHGVRVSPCSFCAFCSGHDRARILTAHAARG